MSQTATRIRLTLPDASVRECPAGTTGIQVAESIGKGLAMAAVGIELIGPVQSLPLRSERWAKTESDTRYTEAGLEVLRYPPYRG